MAESKDPHGERPQTDPHSPHPGYEERDVNVRAVAKAGVGIVLLCVASLGLLYYVFQYYRGSDSAPQAPSEGAGVAAERQPPEPRLQSTPAIDLKQIRSSEDQILGTYGWVDRQKGIVRMPIGRAMDLLAERGLPSRPPAGPQSAAADVSVPGESGLGPKMILPGGPLAAELGGK
jgi:hypothetical protein